MARAAWRTPPRIEVRPSPLHGRGVFAVRRLPAGLLVTSAPVVVVAAETGAMLEDTELGGLLVEWGEDGPRALPLGVVSLVNHSSSPNCEIALVDDDRGLGPAVQLWTLGSVARGAELTIDYVAGEPGWVPWFE